MSKKFNKAVASTVACLVVSSVVQMPAFASTSLSGTGRVQTAIQIAEQSWNGAWKGQTEAVLSSANDANLVDALAVAPFAFQQKAPILITENGDKVNTDVMTELKAKGIKTVYLAAGTGVLTDKMKAELEAAGMTVVRLGGVDRFETAQNITKQIKSVKGYAVVNSSALADALSVASIAAANGYAISIAPDKDTAPADKMIAGLPVYAVGGSGVISDALVTKMGAKRLGGSSRYETNGLVLEGLKDGLKYDTVYVANGLTLVDALSGSVLAAQTNSPIVLTTTELDAKQESVLKANIKKDVKDVKVVQLGGTVSSVAAIEAALTPVAASTVKIDSVVAISNTKILVTLTDDATVTAANFSIVKKGTTTAVAIKNVTKEAEKKIVVETDALVGGTSYTLTAGTVVVNFTGIAADTTTPVINKLTALDTNTFEVAYSDRMDFETATNVANYSFGKEVKVVKAVLNGDRTKVKLTTDAAKRNVVYSVTVDGVKNSDGKAIVKSLRTIGAVEDKINPKALMHIVQNNKMITVTFLDEMGMDKASVEKVENYAIEGLKINSVKAYDIDGDGKLENIVIMTETQEANKSYTLVMQNLTDNSVLKNPLGTVSRTFRGASVDMSSPTVNISKQILSHNNNEVEIYFNDNNALDVKSLEDVSNYTIKDNSGQLLTVVKAAAIATEYPDAYNSSYKGVKITTSQQIVSPNLINYTLEVKGVRDEFGNELKPISGSTYAKYNFMASNIDRTAPFVNKVEFVNPTSVKLTFNERLDKTLAEDPTNYVFNNDLGSAIKANYDYDTMEVTLTTQEQTANKGYEITMNNLLDLYGNVVANAKANFVSTSTMLDVTAPSINYIYAVSKDEIQINMSEAVKTAPATISLSTIVNGNVTGTPIIFDQSGLIDGQKTVVYKAQLPSLPIGTSLTDANYQISAQTGSQFTDAAGNNTPVISQVVGSVATGYTFGGTTANNVEPQVDYVEQLDAKNLKVYFTEPVKVNTLITPAFSKLDSGSDDTHFTAWKYSNVTNFVAGSTVDIPVSAITDLKGQVIAGTTFKFTPYFEDTAKPVITRVYAADNSTIFVNYSEKLNTTGTYKVYYLDSKNNKVYIYNGSGTPANDASSIPSIKINLSTVVDDAKVYYIEPQSGAADIAGNREDISGVKFDFQGSNKTIGKYITGVAIDNAKTITVNTNSKAISSIVVKEIKDASGDLATPLAINSAVVAGSANAKWTLDTPVILGITYSVAVTFTDGVVESYNFVGNTQDLGLTLNQINPTDSLIDFAAFDTKPYSYEVFTLVADAQGVVTKTGLQTDVLNSGINGKVMVRGTTAVSATASIYVVLKDSVDTTRVLYAQKLSKPTAITTFENVKPKIASVVVTNVRTATNLKNSKVKVTFTEAMDPSVSVTVKKGTTPLNEVKSGTPLIPTTRVWTSPTTVEFEITDTLVIDDLILVDAAGSKDLAANAADAPAAADVTAASFTVK